MKKISHWKSLKKDGLAQQMKFGKKLAEEIFPKVTEKAFDKFYEKQNKKEEA